MVVHVSISGKDSCVVFFISPVPNKAPRSKQFYFISAKYKFDGGQFLKPKAISFPDKSWSGPADLFNTKMNLH